MTTRPVAATRVCTDDPPEPMPGAEASQRGIARNAVGVIATESVRPTRPRPPVSVRITNPPPAEIATCPKPREPPVHHTGTPFGGVEPWRSLVLLHALAAVAYAGGTL